MTVSDEAPPDRPVDPVSDDLPAPEALLIDDPTAEAAGRLGRRNLHLADALRAGLLVVLGLYFLLPLVAMARFALQQVPVALLEWGNVTEGWSVERLGAALTDADTLTTAQRSLLLAVAAILLTFVLLLPVATYVEVRALELRGVVTLLTLTPWVVPPIALVVGVAATFRTAAPWFLASTYSLVPFYTLWALPFSYRAIDAGLRAIDTRTLHEAAMSIGASEATFLLRVLLPNIGSSLLVVAALTGATVLGEFAFASLLLKQTLPTHLVVLQGSDARAGLALALVVLLATTALIGLTAAVLRRRGLTFNAAGI